MFGWSAAFPQEDHNQAQRCAVTQCNACHTAHNSQDGSVIDVDSLSGNPNLLADAAPSDICLDCHSRYGQLSSNGQTLTPGGDFFWTTRDVAFTDASGTQQRIDGREHGHNLHSPGHGLTADDVLTVAPGGTFDSSRLGCHSCHDPHGNANFRFLYGAGETASDYPGGYTFAFPAPIAEGYPLGSGQSGMGAETTGQHTAYISGMSDWCANCHEGIHSKMSSAMLHPVDESIGSEISGSYNAYLTTGEMNGDWATAYLPLVPFEDAGNTTHSTTGTTSTSKVMCLTCHRAHASPYPDAGRWDFGQTWLKESQPSREPYLAQYDGNPLNLLNQRSLCNKCHPHDLDDRPGN